MKLSEYLAVGEHARGGPSSVFPILIAILALVTCKALSLSFAASLGVVTIISIASAAIYVGVHRARLGRDGTNPPG